MAWEIVDADDALGPTRYTARPSAYVPGDVDVWVHRVRCKAWRLGTYPDYRQAKAAIDESMAERREGGDGE